MSEQHAIHLKVNFMSHKYTKQTNCRIKDFNVKQTNIYRGKNILKKTEMKEPMSLSITYLSGNTDFKSWLNKESVPTCLAMASFFCRYSICSSTARIFLKASSSAIFLFSFFSLSSRSLSLCLRSSNYRRKGITQKQRKAMIKFQKSINTVHRWRAHNIKLTFIELWKGINDIHISALF